jgi:hypothetical protein
MLEKMGSDGVGDGGGTEVRYCRDTSTPFMAIFETQIAVSNILSEQQYLGHFSLQNVGLF